MNDRRISIKGGADAVQAAAVVAVVNQVLDEEAGERSVGPVRPLPPAWIRIGMSQPFGRFNQVVTPDGDHQLPT